MKNNAQDPDRLPRVVIIEPNHTGHRLWYVSLIAQRAMSMGWAVQLITCPGAAAAPEWAVHMRGLGQMGVVGIPQARNWRRQALRAAIGRDPLAIVVPDGDRWAWSAATARRTGPLSVLLMRPEPQPGCSGRLKWISKRAVATWAGCRPGVLVRALSLVDHGPVDGRGWGISRVPDPVVVDFVGRPEARRELGIDDSESLTLAIGALSSRKGVSSVVRAWAGVHSTRARLALVGPLAADVRGLVQEVAERDARVVMIDRYVSDAEFDTWIAAADRVAALYENIGSSGVALKAWALGTPLLAWAGSELERDLGRLGAAVCPIRRQCWLEEIASAMSAPPLNAARATEHVASLVLESRTDRFARALLRICEEIAPGSMKVGDAT